MQFVRSGMLIRLGLVTSALLLSVCPPLAGLAQAPAPKAAAEVTKVVPRAVLTPNGSWTTYHHDDGHTGYDPAAPALTSVQPTPGWTEAPLDGQVYAEPLIYNGRVFAATLNNTVYALDQSTGMTLWSSHLGTPQASGWVCGNVSPMGILGTPVIDIAANRIYAVAEIAGVAPAPPTYRLFGLDLTTGSTVLSTPIAPSGFDWKIQQERGALALANGYVYVPFGGRDGDCFDGGTPYYGYVVGVPTSGVGSPNVFRTPSGAESVWAAGGVLVDDTSHNIIFATGNAIPCTGSTLSDSIVEANATLSSTTFFEPNDWFNNWCGPDSDLGSASPVLISPSLMFTAGKNGGGFLLNPANLGGIDGQLFPTPKPAVYSQADVCFGNTSAATYGSFAYVAPFVYVECEGRGLVALNLNTSTPAFSPCNASCASPDWHAGGSTTFGPPIVAAGAVWVASNNGLTAYNSVTGALIYQSAGFGVNRFVTPAEAGGQVFVPSHTVIKSFTFGGASLVKATPAQLDFGGQAPTSMSAAQTVTLHNNQAVTLNVTAAALTGANAGNYVKGTDTCSGAAIAAAGACTVQVSFRPGTYGGFPANLTFTDNGPGSPQAVALNGIGALDNQGHLYTLDGWGGIHAGGSAPPMIATTYWHGWNIARSLALFPDGSGGYVLDGYGGLHPFGSAGAVAGFTYWPGWDIARQVVLAPWSTAGNPAGWTLDGYGGLHPFGGAPLISGFTYWGGWDIARGVVILPDSTPGAVAGYTLDGWGGVHAFGGAPAIGNATYWQGSDLARGLTLTPNASTANAAGWTLDAYGGVHPFGTAPAAPASAYWAGWDIARGLVAWTGSGSPGGWVLDGYGGLHAFGGAPPVAAGSYWPGWDIATSLSGPTCSSGSRNRT
jgi:putative pyrroloquinoline-quinone binding quinoprotein